MNFQKFIGNSFLPLFLLLVLFPYNGLDFFISAVPKLFLIAYRLWSCIFTAHHFENTLLQENSIYPISLDQKFGKPDLTQMRHEQHGCEKL